MTLELLALKWRGYDGHASELRTVIGGLEVEKEKFTAEPHRM